MLIAVLAWAAAVACCLAGASFGQTARSVPARGRGRGRSRTRRRRRGRIGVLVSRSGPWLALLAAAGAGATTGAWLPAATAAVAGVLVMALLGLALAPH